MTTFRRGSHRHAAQATKVRRGLATVRLSAVGRIFGSTAFILVTLGACAVPKSKETALPVESRSPAASLEGYGQLAGKEAEPARPNSARVPGSSSDRSDGEEDAQRPAGDGSHAALSALSEADLDGAQLDGELACSFESDAGAVLLIARGNVQSSTNARGVVKVAGYVEPVVARSVGGFDAMLNGGTFGGQGKTILISAGERVTDIVTESPRRSATLTYQRADGATQISRGLWTCGP